MLTFDQRDVLFKVSSPKKLSITCKKKKKKKSIAIAPGSDDSPEHITNESIVEI